MFGKKNDQGNFNYGKMAALEAEVAELQAKADLNFNMLEAVNNSTHLGIWIAYYDANGNQDRVHFSNEFRRMLGYSESELTDDFNALGGIMHPDEAAKIFAAFQAAEADKSNRTKYDIDYRLLSDNRS